MHILKICHDYPNYYRQSSGFFCHQQAQAVSGFCRVGVLAIELISPQLIFKRGLKIGIQPSTDQRLNQLVFLFPNIPKVIRLQYAIRLALGKYLFDKYIKDFGKPDLIHLHVYVMGELAAWIKEKYDIPIVYTEHFSNVSRNQLTRSGNYAINRVIATSDYRIAVSKQFKNLLENKYHVKFNYVPNLYQSDIFYYTSPVKNNNYFTFINVGYLNKNKNHLRLLKAFKQVHNQIPHVRLIIVGSGPEKANLTSFIRKNCLEKNVILAGEKNSIQLKSLFDKSHVKVLSSNIETFGVVLIEAMACGLPIISTKSGGPESIIENESLGILVEKEDYDLYLAMKKVLENYNNYNLKLISENALLKYSYNAIGKRLFNIYTQCLLDY
ncbi:glycosyltransferase [Marivirga arenosa]|uniref:Glycosyltransferase n=1 Tax=Marivirga arenosa TaxID=3059076 RepID=A0AA51ZY43_9BACT|nr:glycosyltransferase [Marivirga sp. BKB1-2]WNB18883.1 glycosyltransferase [Marivirga sp. BKB1-2]